MNKSKQQKQKEAMDKRAQDGAKEAEVNKSFSKLRDMPYRDIIAYRRGWAK